MSKTRTAGSITSKAPPDDPTTAHAQAIVDGLVIAGPYVRAAARRHLADMARAGTPGFPFIFDRFKARRALDFFPDICTIDDGTRFNLLPWQVFVAGSIFGWVHHATGFRRFRKAYIESGKGNGKTPFAAGIGLLMMLHDQEESAEVYAAAAKRDQAMILFTDVVKMVDRSAKLYPVLKKRGKNPTWQLTHKKSGSVFKPLSSDKKKSGLRVSCGIIDELHEVLDRYTVDMLQDGFKNRKQPLLLAITNAGFDRTTICWETHEHAVAVVDGMRVDEELFAYVMALDPGDDPLEDVDLVPCGDEMVPRCWYKTNPGLGITITVQYLRSAVNDARAIPGRENVVRRLNFCEWTDADKGWMTRAAWSACERQLVEFTKPDPEKKTTGGAAIPGDFGPVDGVRAQCVIALDLSFAFDLSALSFLFPEEITDEKGVPVLGADGSPLKRLVGWNEYFTPLDTAKERETKDRVPYLRWIKQGLITGVPGSVVRVEHIARRLAQASEQFEITHAAFDKYRHKELAAQMAELGVDLPWIEHPQGFRRGGQLDQLGADGKPLDNPLWMPLSIDTLEGRIIEKTLEIQESEVTRWQVSGVVIRMDPSGAGNRVFNKAKAVGRIDGTVSLAMAAGAAEMKLPTRSLKGFLSNPVMTP